MALARCLFLHCSLWSSSTSPSLQGQMSTLLLAQRWPARKSNCPSHPQLCVPTIPVSSTGRECLVCPSWGFGFDCSHLPALVTFRKQGPGQVPTICASPAPCVPRPLGLGLMCHSLGPRCHRSQARCWLGMDTGQGPLRFGISGAIFQVLLSPSPVPVTQS